MKIQINKWVPEKFKFQSYMDAETIEVDSLEQQDLHPSYGIRFALRKGDEYVREMEGAEISLLGGEIQVQGYVADKVHQYYTDILRRELWIVIEP